MTTRSNWCIVRFSSINRPNAYDTADSGVTNTILAWYGGRALFHSAHGIPSQLHRSMKSCRNDTVGATTIATPSVDPTPGNMNNHFLPPPVRITTNTRCVPDTMASNAGFCTPLNAALAPYNRFACCSTSTAINASVPVFLDAQLSLHDGIC